MNDQGAWNDDWNDWWSETTEASTYYSEPASDTGGPWPEDRRSGGLVGGRVGSGLIGAVIGVLVVAVLALGGFAVLSRDYGSAGSSASSAPEAGAVGDSAPSASALVQQRHPPTESTGKRGSDQGSTQEAAPDSGTYTGVISQRGTRRSDQDFTVSMTFSTQGSSVHYPTLGCSGTLAPTGNSGGARVYAETITSGQCDPRGTWYVTRGSDGVSISVEYRSSRSDYVVVGQLHR